LLLHHFEHLLLDHGEAWRALRPDTVLQLGGRITSKRTGQFLEWAAQPLDDGATYAPASFPPELCPCSARCRLCGSWCLGALS
jgi:hypothetical protein